MQVMNSMQLYIQTEEVKGMRYQLNIVPDALRACLVHDQNLIWQTKSWAKKVVKD